METLELGYKTLELNSFEIVTILNLNIQYGFFNIFECYNLKCLRRH
jgi:hypothetical protein